MRGRAVPPAHPTASLQPPHESGREACSEQEGQRGPTTRTTARGGRRGASSRGFPLGSLRQQICLSRRFRNAVSLSAGQGDANGIRETETMADRDEDRLHPSACPENGSDHVAICIAQLRSRPARGTWLAERPDEFRFGTSNNRPIHTDPNMAGDPCCPGV